MENKEHGIVIETEGSFAYVQATRHSHCKNCGSCPGDQAMLVKTLNKAHAVVGDTVVIEMNESAMLKSAFIVFVLPLILMFLGAYAGGALMPDRGVFVQIVGGAAGFLIALGIIRAVERGMGKNAKQLPVVTGIIK